MYDCSHELAVRTASLPYMRAAKSSADALAMNDHGPLHAHRVQYIAMQLAGLFALTSFEFDLLAAAALLHDIGMAKDRENHHITSEELVKSMAASGDLPFSAPEASAVGTLCRWHRKQYDGQAVNEELGVRIGLLASILRLADAMDLDYRRSDDYEASEQVIRTFRKDQEQHHLSVRNLIATRLNVTKVETRVELLVHDIKPASLQLIRLIDELLGTAIRWPVAVLPVHNGSIPLKSHGRAKKAVVFAYCNAHGLVQAAISKRQLESMGFEVEVICDRVQTSSPDRFWKEICPQRSYDNVDLAVILDVALSVDYLGAFADVVRANRSCKWVFASSLCLCHQQISSLVDAGVEVIVGDDRVLFAGSTLDHGSLFWIKVAGLCNFDDPPVSHSGATEEEAEVALGIRGRMKQCYPDEIPIAEYEVTVARIAADDRAFFKTRAAEWNSEIDSTNIEVSKRGKVIIVGELPMFGRFVYDVLYRAIERQGVRQHGSTPEFRCPYAIYRKKTDGKVHVLFFSYFLCAENAVPVKYFVRTASDQLGRCCTIWQSFESTEEADVAIDATVNRINEHFE